MTLEIAPQNRSAQTNLPDKLIRPGRESELNGIKNNPTFGKNFKRMNVSAWRVADSKDDMVYLSGVDSKVSGNSRDEKALDVRVSLFSCVREVEPKNFITIREFIKDIRNGRWKQQVEPLRQFVKDNKRKEYDQKKSLLPGITLSALCKSRAGNLSSEEKRIIHSGWLQADFDQKDNPHLADSEALREIRQKLLLDPHIGAVFCGPSREGIKAIVRIDSKRHQDSWFAAETYFAEKYSLKLDKATKDPLRLCFVSYDPLAEISQNFTPLPIPEIKKAAAQEIWHSPLETTAKDIQEILRFIPPRPDYDTWFRIASAVWSVLPMDEGCRLLREWSPEEKEGEYAQKYRCRLMQITIGTLIHIAKAHGFDARVAWKSKRWAGRIRLTNDPSYSARRENLAIDPASKEIISEYDIPRERLIEALHDGQVGDAKLWADTRRDLRVWNIHAREWMIYEKGIWRKDEGQTTTLDISETLCRIYDALIASLEKEIGSNPAPDGKLGPRSQELRNLIARRKSLTRHDYLQGVEKLAAKCLQVPATVFDTKPYLLVVENGVLDLEQDIFREYCPTDYATYKLSACFDALAKCPTWTKFIERSMAGDEETIAYLRRSAGYSFTGYTHEDAIFFCYGDGANGKSTFFGGLELLLGDLMTTIPAAALLGDKHDSTHDYYKASMEGRRLVKTDEIPEGKRLAEHHVKALTGGDDVAARMPYGKPYKYKPTFKFWIVGNHKPEIRGTDHGIWRRIHLIHWKVRIPEEMKRPRHEILAEFEKEKSGILNWIIMGLADFIRCSGLKPPKSVLNDTEEYRAESDQMAQFLEQKAVRKGEAKAKLKSILPAFLKYCEENGELPRYTSSKQLAAYFRCHGYETKKDGHDNTVCILGIGLLADKKDWDLIQFEESASLAA